MVQKDCQELKKYIFLCKNDDNYHQNLASQLLLGLRINTLFTMAKGKNFIGLDEKIANDLATDLNDLLANYQIYYQNLRGFHWNIQGASFFELHLKFEEYYNDARIKIDEIAERILTLGETPSHTLSDYVAESKIKEAKNVHDGQEGVKITSDNISVLLKKERLILKKASEAGDEGTVTLLSEYITQQEKVLWMLHSYLA